MRNIAGELTGPAFNGSYEYRILKYLSLEASISNMLPRTQRYETLPVYSIFGNGVHSSSSLCPPCVFVSIPDRTRVTFLPFGFRGARRVS